MFLPPPCQAYLFCAIGLSVFALTPSHRGFEVFVWLVLGVLLGFCFLFFFLLFGGNRKITAGSSGSMEVHMPFLKGSREVPSQWGRPESCYRTSEILKLILIFMDQIGD